MYIHVPSEFNSNYPQIEYPVLYVFDPDAHFLSIVSMIDRMSTNVGEEICPQMIIVGVRNTDRVRDMFPIHEEDRFHDFLENELIPYIDDKYPTKPYRVLFGHSITGLRTVHTAIFYPHLFNAYIALDPSLCHEYCGWFTKYEREIEDFDLGGNRMFLAMAHTMVGKDTTAVRQDTSGRASHMNAMMDFSENMLQKNNEGEQYQWKYYPDRSHNSVTLPATLDGIEQIFSWYKNNTYEFIFADDTSPEQAFNAYKEHYEQVSSQLGYTEWPSEGQLHTLIWYLHHIKNMTKKALLFAQLNVQNYPNSSSAKEQLEEIKMNLGVSN